MRFCLAPNCPELVEGRRDHYCSAHAPAIKPWARKTERQKSGWAWGRIRSRVLSRARWKCEIKGRDCQIAATEVDHIVPRAAGGTDDLDNLRAACPKCHKTKSEADRLAGYRRTR